MKKKEPNFKWWQRLIFKFFGVRRVDILKLALAQLEYQHEQNGTVCYLCPLIYFIMADLGMVNWNERLMPADMPMGYYVHEFIPKFDNPNGTTYWTQPWWGAYRYEVRKEFLQKLIKEYKNDKKRFQINIYNHG